MKCYNGGLLGKFSSFMRQYQLLETSTNNGAWYERVHKNASQVNKHFIKKVVKILFKFENHLYRIKTKAQEFEAAFRSLESYNHLTYKNRNDKTNPVEFVTRFSHTTKVNLNESFVHIPVELYNRNKFLLQEIIWSKGLNEVFQEAMKSDASVTWQYIGFITGANRLYPGAHLPQ